MRKIPTAFGALYLALTLFISLAYPADAPIAEFNDPGAAIRVKVGERFAISLDSNPTTGYIWQLSIVPGKKILVMTDHKYFPPEAHLIGAGGRERWVFRATGEGRGVMDFKYLRPWERNVPSGKEEIFNVTVSSGAKKQGPRTDHGR